MGSKPCGHVTVAGYSPGVYQYNLRNEFIRIIKKTYYIYPNITANERSEMLGITPKVLRNMLKSWDINK